MGSSSVSASAAHWRRRRDAFRRANLCPLTPNGWARLLVLLRKLAERKQTMLIVGQEMHFARKIADRVVFMHSAKIVESGRPDQIFGTPQDERLRRFLKRMGA